VSVREKQYIRRDIQGLRAIGALLIVAFHIWFGGVSGGVDVFFVVSGYLMASGFLRRNQSIDVLGSYERFLTRVAPQAVLTLACILLIWPVFVNPFKWNYMFSDIAAGAAYLENIHLILRGDDYFTRDGIMSFVQHFWAMSAIGQVYFIWPLIAAAATFIARKSKYSSTVTLTCLLGILVASSFVWGVRLTQTNPKSAYFDVFGRFWEFGVGALIGLAPQCRDLFRRHHAAMLSWLGVALLLSCGFLIGSTSQFPGYAALWPVAAAALILLASREDDRRNAGWILAAAPLTLLGGISLGIYLWHWPLFVLMIETARGSTLSFAQGLGVFVAAIIAAVATKTFVDRSASGPGRFINAPYGAFAVVLCLLSVGVAAKVAQRAVERHGVAIEARLGIDSKGYRPGPLAIIFDLPEPVLTNCNQVNDSEEAVTCAFGDESASTTIVLVGNSRAGHWLPALQAIAGAKGWRVVNMTKSACPFSDPADMGDLFDQKCKNWTRAALRKVIEMRPDFVVALGTSFQLGDRLTERMPDGYVSWFEKLTAEGIPVVAIRNTPTMPNNVPGCVFSREPDRLDGCGASRALVLDDAAFEEIRRSAPPGVSMLDMADAFCDDRHCWATRDNIIVYNDDRHISATYMKTIGRMLATRIDKALSELREDQERKAAMVDASSE
jgi:peptidoglycan/LPS O-acetylase OafA/YrhL